jgi:hypothetical protein
MRTRVLMLTYLLILVVGGWVFSAPEVDAQSWTQSPATGPAARESHAMAFDSSRGVTVLFGGEISSPQTSPTTTPYGDTWLFDGTNWTQGPGGPSARWSHGLRF